jgi:Tetratricopeptide repeat
MQTHPVWSDSKASRLSSFAWRSMNQWLRFYIAGSLALLLVSPSRGQTGSSGSTQPTRSGSSAASATPLAPEMQGPLYVFGRVLLEGGQPVPEPVSVGLSCGIGLVQVVHSDLKGNFQFALGAALPQSSAGVGANNDPLTALDAEPKDLSGGFVGDQRLFGCELRVSIPGYQPLTKTISDKGAITGIDAGTLILTRIAGEKGAAISATSLLAPNSARKEFEKGEQELRNNHLESATQDLEKAVSQYDKYAAAWNELGQIYSSRHEFEKSRQAFAKAIGADPQYIPPYVSLAVLELLDGQYESAVETATKALELQPGLVPTSFVQAAANFHLNRLDAAEKSTRDAESGPHQSVPQLHLLLAAIFLQKHDYSNAAEQMRTYLKEAPQGQFASETKQRLEQIEKLAVNPDGTSTLAPRQPQPSPHDLQAGSAEIRVCLRMEDDSSFVGSANVRLMPAQGYEVVGVPAGAAGETLFEGLAPGTYTVEASAPGFSGVRKQTQIDANATVRTVFLTMKPRPTPAPSASTSTPAPTVTPAAIASPPSRRWIPPGIDDMVPRVDAGVQCPLQQVISGAGRRMKELVESLQKFSAKEKVEHFSIDAAGSRGKPEDRTFDYVVTITQSRAGVFNLDEYRNGSIDPAQFPAQIATTGLSAMALIFHPSIISDFNVTCEGLGQWDGHPAWQIHFAQRPDRPNRIREYVIAKTHYPVPLKGRVWIDAGTYQIRRLETQLMKPVAEIALTEEYISIDYGSVRFHTHDEELWLPLDAEAYWERRGRRVYRRHAFSDFKVFEVDSAQQINAPKESYCFKNITDRDIDGILTVSPISEVSAKVVSLEFTVPSGRSVCKLVGPDKDVSMAANEVSSAVFKHNGVDGSIAADANLVQASTLDLIGESSPANLTH